MAKKKRRLERERVVRPPEKKRPLSITIIAWILIIYGIISIPLVMFGVNDPHVVEIMSHVHLPISVQWFLTVAGIAVFLISGRGMLRGENWARWLYIVFTGLSLILNLIIAPNWHPLVSGVLVFILMTGYLVTPGANVYFNVKS